MAISVDVGDLEQGFIIMCHHCGVLLNKSVLIEDLKKINNPLRHTPYKCKCPVCNSEITVWVESIHE